MTNTTDLTPTADVNALRNKQETIQTAEALAHLNGEELTYVTHRYLTRAVYELEMYAMNSHPGAAAIYRERATIFKDVVNAAPVWLVEIEFEPDNGNQMFLLRVDLASDPTAECLNLDILDSVWCTAAAAQQWADRVTAATGVACTITQMTYADAVAEGYGE